MVSAGMRVIRYDDWFDGPYTCGYFLKPEEGTGAVCIIKKWEMGDRTRRFLGSTVPFDVYQQPEPEELPSLYVYWRNKRD